MRRDHRHVLVPVALVLVLLTAGCTSALSSSQSGVQTPTTQSEAATVSDDDATPVPAPGTTVGPVSQAPHGQPREAPSESPATASPPTTPTSLTPTAAPVLTDTPATPQSTPVPAPAPAPAPSSGGSGSASPAVTGETSTSPTSSTSSPSTTDDTSTETSSTDSSSGTTVEVLDVLDGDTIRVAYSDGSTGLVNLAGVDAPDLYGGVDPGEFAGVPDTSGGRMYLYAWGWSAQRTLRGLVGETVQIRVVDSVTPTVDDYASTTEYDDVQVAYVSVDEREINRVLLRRGVARATDTDHPNRATFLDIMRTAQQTGRGLWGTSDGLHVP